MVLCFFANEISYTLLVPSIKISILLLYRRIFAVRKFRIASLITGGLVMSWCLAVFITVFLQCRPIALNWDKTLEGTCIDPKKFFFGNAISNLLIDVVILALPIPMVLQLQLRLSQKLTILSIFLLGGLLRDGSRYLDLRRALRRNHLRLFTDPSTPATDTMLFLLMEHGSFRRSTGKL
ncbi:hypothetical protein APSETT445_006537 [Aspergillus pseudonomiae]